MMCHLPSKSRTCLLLQSFKRKGVCEVKETRKAERETLHKHTLTRLSYRSGAPRGQYWQANTSAASSLHGRTLKYNAARHYISVPDTLNCELPLKLYDISIEWAGYDLTALSYVSDCHLKSRSKYFFFA